MVITLTFIKFMIIVTADHGRSRGLSSNFATVRIKNGRSHVSVTKELHAISKSLAENLTKNKILFGQHFI